MSDNANKQNAIGNWLMLVSQVICTNAYFLQLNTTNNQTNTLTNEDTLEMLQSMKNALEKEIENLKNQI